MMGQGTLVWDLVYGKAGGFFKRHGSKLPFSDSHSLCLLCLGEALNVNICVQFTHFLKQA